MLENPKVRTFIELLEAEGFTLRALWRGKTEAMGIPPKPHEIGAYSVVGDGKRPAVGVIIIHNMGEDGFGLYLDCESARMEENVRQIAGRLANVGELVDEEQGARNERV